MSTLFLISDLDRGGYEMRLLDMVKHRWDGFVPYICVTSDHCSLLPQFEACGIAVIKVPVDRAYLEFAKILKIRRFVLDNEIRIINSYELKGVMIALLIKFSLLHRVLVVHHTVDLLHSYKDRHKMLLKFLLRLVDKSLCNSESSKRILQEGYVKRDKIQVITNGVDVTKFMKDDEKKASLKKELQIASDEYVIGTVANFREEKNYPFLLDAFGKILELRDNVRLLCVGGGTLFEATCSAVRCSERLSQKIIFTGYVENVERYMNAMDLFVLCSKKEGFPNALIQAMSMELPVVAARVGGCCEIIDDQVDGLLYESGDAEEFVQKVVELFDRREKASDLALKAKTKIREKYALSVMLGNYRGFFDGLLKSL